MDFVKGMYNYGERQFDATRTSPTSVRIGLNCGYHDHEAFIVGKHDGHTFLEAVQHCAAMLSEECDSFKGEVIPALKDRLNALAEFVPRFESSDFQFGQMEVKPGIMSSYSFSDDALRFIRVCTDMKWVQPPLDWGEWKGSSEAVHLRDEPGALAGCG